MTALITIAAAAALKTGSLKQKHAKVAKSHCTLIQCPDGGICDGCGNTFKELFDITHAPAVGVCMCHGCLKRPKGAR